MTASDIDHIINHLSLKKSLRRWRWLALGLAIVALIAIFARGGTLPTSSDHVARLMVEGLITGNDRQLKLLREIAESDRAKALIVRINSPGGTTAGSEALYEEIRKVAAKKPVVAVMDTVAASGGYITALAADRIIARGNTITGSIGVIFSYPEISGLLSTLGIRMEELKSGELKAEPSPYRPASEKAKQVSMEMIMDGFAWFKGLVAERRKLTPERTAVLSDGRVYSGRQALKEGLIDAIGGEDEAMAWLETEMKIPKGLKIEDWRPPRPWLESALGVSIPDTILESLGLASLHQAVERSRLDGMLALWHPSLSDANAE
jgi:protease IV